ncbi:hypothetical protein LBMAG27_24650 [Bacteroidota bacterium]|nr:hypothetical protein LBMAG27_24650 [Bacteroidota bacterium]
MLIAAATDATTWHVGPSQTYNYCSQVASLVQNGDTVLIDFALYQNDTQVIWAKNNLYIAGSGVRPRLEAGSIIANDNVNGKGIFVISGANVHVHNIEFANAAVIDHNGAGIRQEGVNLLVTHCKFDGNEMGILCGSIADCKTTVEYSEFVNGGSVFNPGYQHNIYINHIDTLVFRYNYSHDAIAEGHELKSRANYNFIYCNRIANEQSIDSRTIDLPNGGTSVIVGNIIEQGPNSANSNLLGYGLEGFINTAPNNLYVSGNTFINKKSTGSFIHVAAGTDTLFVKNNFMTGASTGGLIIGTPTVLDSSNNIVNATPTANGFIDVANFNYHLTTTAQAINAGIVIPDMIRGHELQPTQQYVDTCSYEARVLSSLPDIGAFEYNEGQFIAEESDITFSIYPQPAGSWFYLHTNRNFNSASLQICDMTGRTVWTGNLAGTETYINTADWNTGVYLIQLNDIHDSCNKMVIVQ